MLVTTIFFTPAVLQAEEFSVPGNGDTSPADFDHHMIANFVASGEKGVISALLGSPELRGSRLQREFFLRDGQDFDAKYRIENHTDDPLKYHLLCFLNYVQKKCTFDNTKTSAYPVNIGVNEKKVINITMPEIGRGAHDFLLLAVREIPHSWEEPSAGFELLYRRANLWVESSDFPLLAMKDKVTRSQNSHIGSDLILEFTSVTPPDVVRGDESGQRLRVEAHAGAPEGRETRLGVLIFGDLTQADISLDEHVTKVIMFTNKGAAYNKILIDIHDVNHASKIWGILVQNPFIRLEREHGEISILPSDVLMSNQVPIGTRSSNTIPTTQ